MHDLKFIWNDIYLSPLFIHGVLFVIFLIKDLMIKWFSEYHHDDHGWDSVIMVAMFINPLLAFWADSFWLVWIQTLLLSIPLYLSAFYIRQIILHTSYSDAAAGMLGAVFLCICGHVASGIIVLIRYLWHIMESFLFRG